jgi:hypothetical protein
MNAPENSCCYLERQEEQRGAQSKFTILGLALKRAAQLCTRCLQRTTNKRFLLRVYLQVALSSYALAPLAKAGEMIERNLFVGHG